MLVSVQVKAYEQVFFPSCLKKRRGWPVSKIFAMAPFMQSKIDVPCVVLGNFCGTHVIPSESVGTTVYLHLPNVLQLVQSAVTLLPQQ